MDCLSPRQKQADNASSCYTEQWKDLRTVVAGGVLVKISFPGPASALKKEVCSGRRSIHCSYDGIKYCHMANFEATT